MAAPSDECFHGGYVLPDHPAPPPYELPQADPFVPDITSPLLSKRCAGNQDWADWRWVPSSRQCASGLRGRTYYEVCPQLRGRRLFYVGDSTQFEMFVSMGMLMGGQISLRPQERPLAWCPWAVRLSQVPVQDRGHAKDVAPSQDVAPFVPLKQEARYAQRVDGLVEKPHLPEVVQWQRDAVVGTRRLLARA